MACSNFTVWLITLPITFCQISSNVSTPSCTFFRQRSISPRIKQAKWKKEVGRNLCKSKKHQGKAMNSSYLVASVYPPLPRCVALKKHNFVAGITTGIFSVKIPQWLRKVGEINSRTVKDNLAKWCFSPRHKKYYGIILDKAHEHTTYMSCANVCFPFRENEVEKNTTSRLAEIALFSSKTQF